MSLLLSMALFGFGTTFLFLLVLSIWTFACVRGPYWLLTVGHFGVDLFLTILYGGFKEYTHSIIPERNTEGRYACGPTNVEPAKISPFHACLLTPFDHGHTLSVMIVDADHQLR